MTYKIDRKIKVDKNRADYILKQNVVKKKI